MPDNMMMPVLSGDAAKRLICDDSFGLKSFADVLAQAISSRISADGYAIGIEGKWGSGKTTLLNFVAEILVSKPNTHHKIIRFDPWLIGNKEALLQTFFKELIDAIKDLGHAKPLDKEFFDLLTSRLNQYATYLTAGAAATIELGHLEPTWHAATLGLVLKGLSKCIEFINKVLSKPTPTLETLRERIITDLKGLNDRLPGTRITILIDDTDRLDSKESIEIMRLIKAVANFPLLTYVACFDRKILSAQVADIIRNSAGEEYIEKIFQQIIPIPPQEPFALRRFVRSQLAKIFQDEMNAFRPEDMEFDARQDALFDKWIGRLIESPRDAIRLCESIKFGWPYLRNKADFLDYIWLQLIKLKCTPLYNWTQDYVTSLGSLRDGGRPGDGVQKTEAVKLRNIMNGLWKSGDAYLTGITYFLPGVENFHLAGDKAVVFKFDSTEELSKYEAGRRLGSPSHWRLYFAFDKPSYAIDDADLIAFRETTVQDWRKAASILKTLATKPQPLPGQHLAVFLDRLRDQKESFSPEEQLGMAKAFVEVMDSIPRSIGVNFGGDDSWRKAARLMGKEVGPHFSKLVAEGASVNWLAMIMRDQAFALGAIDKNQTHPERQWLTQPEFDQAVPAILSRFQTMGIQKIFQSSEPLQILFCWEQLGDASALRASIAAVAAGHAFGFIKAMQAMQSWVSSSNKGLYRALHSKVVAHFMDADEAKTKLIAIADNKNMGETQRTAKELLEAWD